MSVMMQEKYWTIAFFQAYTPEAGVGNYKWFYIFIVEVRVYKLRVLTVSTLFNAKWFMFHHLPQNSWETKH